MTNTPNKYAPVCDYLKFVVAMDFDLGQQECGFIAAKIQEYSGGLELFTNCKLTVLGPSDTTGGKNRYVWEAWGPHAISLLHFVPTDWLEHLARADYRVPLLNVTHEMAEAWIMRTAQQGKGRRNVESFNTKGKFKTNTRDVGGRGVRIGSRKSDSFTVVYFRGQENAAMENRLQGNAAQELGMRVLVHYADPQNGGDLETIFLGLLAQAAASEMYKATGAGTHGQLQAQMLQAAGWKRQLDIAMSMVDDATANVVFDQRDQVVNVQYNAGATFEPTEKGWNHPEGE